MASEEGTNSDTPTQLTAFDVVAAELPGPVYMLAEEYNGKQQIGNNRFNVLVDMYVDAFDKHDSENNADECDKIVGIVQNVTSRKRDQRYSEGGACFNNPNRGRFLVKLKLASGINDENIDFEWKELDEEASRSLIRQTLKLRMEEKTKSMFEPEPLQDYIGLGSETMDAKNCDNFFLGSSASIFRRSQSASNLTSDALKAFRELPNLNEMNDQDEFEPIPINGSLESKEMDIDGSAFNMPGIQSYNKKRGRRRSLLRRSNSFESAFDKKKAFKNLYGVFPQPKDQPSFIRSHNDGDVYPPTTRPPSNFVSRAFNYVMSNVPGTDSVTTSSNYSQNRTIVPTLQGMDIIFEEDCKTLSTKPWILGNNRLRVLVRLERDRFLGLSPVEQQKTASDLVKMIGNNWKGRLLVEKEPSYYAALSHEEALGAVSSLLLGDRAHNTNNSPQQAATGPMISNSAQFPSLFSSQNKATFNSLLPAAPQLPEFLRIASNDILNSGRNKSSGKATTKQRQAAAVEALKARSKSRLISKDKSNSEN